MAGRAAEDWLPWRGTVNGAQLPDALIRSDGAVAIPYDPEQPTPLVEHVTQMDTVRLGERTFLILNPGFLGGSDS